MRLNGQLPFNTVNDGLEPFGIHSAHCTGLLRIPYDLITVQPDLAQLIQVSIFTAHPEYRYKIVLREILFQLFSQLYRMQYLIHEVQGTRKDSRLVSRGNGKCIILQQQFDILLYGFRSANSGILFSKYFCQQGSMHGQLLTAVNSLCYALYSRIILIEWSQRRRLLQV